MILSDELLTGIHESLREEPGKSMRAASRASLTRTGSSSTARASSISPIRCGIISRVSARSMISRPTVSVTSSSTPTAACGSIHSTVSSVRALLFPRTMRGPSRPGSPHSATAGSMTRCRGLTRSCPGTFASTECCRHYLWAERASALGAPPPSPIASMILRTQER